VSFQPLAVLAATNIRRRNPIVIRKVKRDDGDGGTWKISSVVDAVADFSSRRHEA
jgi:hypothetical protein